MPLLDSDIAAPVRDLDVSFQQLAVRQGFCEFVPHAHFLHGASFDFAIWAVCVARTLLLWILFAFRVQGLWERDSVRDVGGGELEFRLLLLGYVG